MKALTGIALLALGCTCIAGCGEKETTEKATPGAVSGKILERSITDDMLPYDSVTSQPPRANPSGDGEDSENSAEGPGPAPSDAPAASAAPAPAPMPDAE